MTDIDKDSIREWYIENDMEYLPSDWGHRAENGESASKQVAEPERIGGAGGDGWVYSMDPATIVRDEGRVRPRQEHMKRGLVEKPLKRVWDEERDPIDRAMVEAIEDFFARYAPGFDLLPALATLLWEPDRSLGDVATEQGVSKQAVSQARKRAVARVERTISRYWHDPEGSDAQRAWAVFVDFWRQRFGTDFPHVNGAASAEWL